MTTDSVVGYAAGGLRPRGNPKFPALFVAAVRQLTQQPGNTLLLQAFWTAYEHRRPIEWLGESGHLPGYPDGLAFALREALTMVRYPERKRIPCRCNHVIPEDAVTRLRQTAEGLADDLPLMRSFERRISEDGTCIVSVEVIEQALATAFHRYIEQQGNTAAGAPW